jgi:hypothetical protein
MPANSALGIHAGRRAIFARTIWRSVSPSIGVCSNFKASQMRLTASNVALAVSRRIAFDPGCTGARVGWALLVAAAISSAYVRTAFAASSAQGRKTLKADGCADDDSHKPTLATSANHIVAIRLTRWCRSPVGCAINIAIRSQPGGSQQSSCLAPVGRCRPVYANHNLNKTCRRDRRCDHWGNRFRPHTRTSHLPQRWD